MEYKSVAQIAEQWGISDRRVRILCQQSKIDGVIRKGRTWLIPADAKKPIDGRTTRYQRNNSPYAELFAEVDALKAELDKRRPLTQGELQRLRDEFLIEYTYNSNAIEGNTLTLQETALVLEGITVDKKPLKDHLEAVGHRDAFLYVQDLVKNNVPFSESIIKQIHTLVLMDRPDDRGIYRRIPVRIMGAFHVPPDPILVPEQMENLITEFAGNKKLHPIERAALFHLKFEGIHPFVDGNGRTGRLILNLMLMQAGYPPINVKYSDRKRYYDAFDAYYKYAAEELSKDIDAPSVFIGTIHSYIHSLISPFFGSPQVINLYWEIYGDQIRQRIKNDPAIQTVAESNQRYIDKYGALSEEIVRANITRISYNETSFNSLYHGGLGHDDLISFAKTLIEKHPVIQKKIVEKFAFIFIDEYQDTSSEVLKLFYNVIKGTSVQMFLLGDRMQQIYKNYDGSFESELKTLSEPDPLRINYRSVKAIVDILNNIYNDSDYYQSVAPGNETKVPDYAPEIIITNSISDEIEKHKKERPDLLILYLLNKDKFGEIGASNLYNAYNRMDKYSFVRKYHAVDVLSDLTSENPDPLMRFLFLFDTLMEYYKQRNFGRIIAYTKRDHEFIISETHRIAKHDDKKALLELYGEVAIKYSSNQLQIGSLLEYLKEKKIIREDFYEGILSDKEYEPALEISIVELRNLAAYLKNPQISTQHGVKGESHTSVLFVATDSTNTPVVHMYEFLRIWSQVNFSLKEIEDFYYEYLELVVDTEKKLGMHIKDLTSATHNNNEANKQILKDASEAMQNKFKENKIYELLCEPHYAKYLNKPTLTNAKACFKESTVYSCLVAYKLFYVGCSRARKNLSIILDAKKITAFKTELTGKLSQIGFIIKEK